MKKPIDSLILTLRGQKVLLDADLAELYGVPTKVFNQAIKRNSERFPEDFHFRLSAEETEALKCQFGTSRPAGADLKSQSVTATPESRYNGALKSQLATSKHGGRRTAPFAFTEHGAIMAATVLSSPEAVKMSVYVVRAFIQMREQIAANSEVLKRLAEIDKTLLKHDKGLQLLWGQLQPLLTPPPGPKKGRIGFHPGKT